MAQSHQRIHNLSDFVSPAALELLSASGGKLVRQIGIEVVRGVVYDVLTGRNLRDSTEVFTRRRVAALNLATVGMFLRGSTTSEEFVQNLPELASEILHRNRTIHMVCVNDYHRGSHRIQQSYRTTG